MQNIRFLRHASFCFDVREHCSTAAFLNNNNNNICTAKKCRDDGNFFPRPKRNRILYKYGGGKSRDGGKIKKKRQENFLINSIEDHFCFFFIPKTEKFKAVVIFEIVKFPGTAQYMHSKWNSMKAFPPPIFCAPFWFNTMSMALRLFSSDYYVVCVDAPLRVIKILTFQTDNKQTNNTDFF